MTKNHKKLGAKIILVFLLVSLGLVTGAKADITTRVYANTLVCKADKAGSFYLYSNGEIYDKYNIINTKEALFHLTKSNNGAISCVQKVGIEIRATPLVDFKMQEW